MSKWVFIALNTILIIVTGGWWLQPLLMMWLVSWFRYKLTGKRTLR